MRITHFTSDQHFGHNNILKYDRRPFHDIGMMLSKIIERYNSTVSEGDCVLWLGDSFFGIVSVMANDILSAMNGKKILVRGNHDRKSKSWFRDAGFIEVHDSITIEDEIVGEILCVHNPLKSATLKHTGPLIHGHKHSLEPQPRGHQSNWVDVGVTAWDYYPARYNDVIDLLSRDYSQL